MNPLKAIISASLLIATACPASAQQDNNDITIAHEVVPEEQAATRLRLNPVLSTPKVTPGRIPAATTFGRGELTPYIYTLDPAAYATSLGRYPWRGYASLGYGPQYNLAASAGYRFLEKESLTLDGFIQFDGMHHRSPYPALEWLYPGKVTYRRNTGLIGSNLAWRPAAGTLSAGVLYQYSAYNFPILDLPTALVEPHSINANVLKLDAKWASKIQNVDYSAAIDYHMIAFAKNEAENRGKITASALWHASTPSAWGADVSYSVAHSTIIGNKGILHLAPYYAFKARTLSAKIGGTIDIRTGNVGGKALVIAPQASIMWQALPFAAIWANASARMDDNARAYLYNEQPYLLPQFAAGFSRLFAADGGITIGPWKGAAFSVFIGHTNAKDWYMPAIETGFMTPVHIKGLHGGVAFNYTYRQFLNLRLKAEMAQSPSGNYSKGYALWRDHAKYNFTANATVRPIRSLSIDLGYHLRTHRQKMMPEGRNLNLLNISNLNATATYRFTPQWSAFLSGQNLLNHHWYLGPSVPAQGIVGMIGAAYKF